jgi:general secretion pathway protein L
MNTRIDPSLQPVWLKQLRLNYLAPMQRHLEAFWSWWTGQLIDLMPTSLQSTFSQRDQRDFIECDGDTFIVRRGTMSENGEIARIPLTATGRSDVELPGGAKESVVLLPADRVLIKSVTLPLATEENLREVLSFEMDRQTPFSADQVYYDCIVTRRDASRKTLSVDLVLAPRKSVDELLEDLASSGLSADVVSTRDVDGAAVLPINLLPRRKRSNPNSFLLRLNGALAVVTVLLFVMAISLPLLQKRQVVGALEPRLVEAIAQAESADELRQQVERLVAGSGYLVKKKRSGSSVLRTINELTRALPDHTWINRLDITETDVQLQGQSSSSASLISLLESSPMFENVRFRSPVTRIANTSEERFHLSAEIEREP